MQSVTFNTNNQPPAAGATPEQFPASINSNSQAGLLVSSIGGNGGDGGHGGGGGGGCGGISASVYIAGVGPGITADNYTNNNEFVESGRAGLGGVGGGSTGNPGGRGSDGLLVEVLVVD